MTIEKDSILKNLSYEMIKINWNKNPVKMDLFLSFLTIKVERSYNHLGSFTGWSLLFNKEIKLEIGGGTVKGIEYLNDLKYGEKLDNPYNNYVTPFYLFDILTEEGKKFFLGYYKEEIDKTLKNQTDKVISLSNQLKDNKNLLINMADEYHNLLK